MLKLGKICILFLAVGVVTAMSSPALAQEKKKPEEINGHTLLSIVEVSKIGGNVSFTVPLSVTMAVVEGEAQVAMPEEAYTITNESAAFSKDAFNIAVIQMKFEKVKGSLYNTVEGPDVSKQGDMIFQIGGLTMPALSKPASSDVELRAVGSQFLKDSTPEGYKKSGLKEIPAATPGNALKLDLAGKVSDQYPLKDAVAAEQFKITYIITPMVGGKPLQKVYAGNDYDQAGQPIMPDQ